MLQIHHIGALTDRPRTTLQQSGERGKGAAYLQYVCMRRDEKKGENNDGGVESKIPPRSKLTSSTSRRSSAFS